MKHLLILLFISVPLSAEVVEVFATSSNGDTYSIEEKLGKIDTGNSPLKTIIKKTKKSSWKGEPFYGPVIEYILKDTKGKLYVVHFEYEEGHKTFDGFRFAINTLKKKKKFFYVRPYLGSSITDKNLTGQLKAITQNKTERTSGSNAELPKAASR